MTAASLHDDTRKVLQLIGFSDARASRPLRPGALSSTLPFEAIYYDSILLARCSARRLYRAADGPLSRAFSLPLHRLPPPDGHDDIPGVEESDAKAATFAGNYELPAKPPLPSAHGTRASAALCRASKRRRPASSLYRRHRLRLQSTHFEAHGVMRADYSITPHAALPYISMMILDVILRKRFRFYIFPKKCASAGAPPRHIILPLPARLYAIGATRGTCPDYVRGSIRFWASIISRSPGSGAYY